MRLPALGHCILLGLIPVLLLLLSPRAKAGGGPENVVLIIDPTSPESMYIGNYYRNARNIPPRNVLYVPPLAADYTQFVSGNLSTFLGSLNQHDLANHVDYVVILPGANFYIPAPGLVTDGCSPVTRFAAPSPYTMAFMATDVQAGLSSQTTNRYYAATDSIPAFTSSVAWLGGQPSTAANARKYFIGAMLGYSGERGNTLPEIINMIDRSIAVEGSRPAGTFYFMQTSDIDRSGPRHGLFPAAVSSIQALGGAAELLMAILPTGRHDCLGIMTGWADPAIDATDMAILRGAFCDHLTSYAATFDNGSQVKMSRWIAKGAAGTAGTVEEPCNYPGKFPSARLHVYYYQGASLGESWFRSHGLVPFQSLFLGDPLTRPFAYIPTVNVPNAPTGPVSGTIPLNPIATTAKPGAGIAKHDLYVDGRRTSSVTIGGNFTLDTTTLADGRHDVRVVSYDDTTLATQGRWVGTITTNNSGRTLTLNATPPTGDRSTLFTAAVSASGGTVSQIRLLANNRVFAASTSASPSFQLLGDAFGAGPVQLVAEASFTDGRRAFSPPAAITIAYANPPTGATPNHAPVAYSYSKDVPRNDPILIELPASDLEDGNLTYAVLTAPTQATLDGAGPVRTIRPQSNATGTDTLVFTANDGHTPSNQATITIRYLASAGDTVPPSPNPMTFAVPPGPSGTSAVLMTATSATDVDSPPVEYFFNFVSGGPGGNDSLWQSSVVYADIGLQPNTEYTYRVRARDSASPTQNVTAYSTAATTATRIETPTDVTAGAITAGSVSLIAVGPFTNLAQGQSGIYFDSVPTGLGAGIRVWQQTTTATVTGLQPNTGYTFQARARNRNGLETSFGPSTTITTAPAGVRGDCDGNGVFQAGPDTQCFVAALLGTDTSPPGGIARSDMNGDGRTNGADVQTFVRCATGGCP